MFQNKLPLMCMYHNLVNLGLVYISWNGKLSNIELKKKNWIIMIQMDLFQCQSAYNVKSKDIIYVLAN